MVPPPTSRRTLASLADRLRHGPLHAMVTLYDKAQALAAEAPTDERRQLEQLNELIRLAHLAMDRFQVFTIELKVLAFELGEKQKRDPL